MTLQSTSDVDLDPAAAAAPSQAGGDARAPRTSELLRNLHSTHPEPGDDPYRALERVETLPRIRALRVRRKKRPSRRPPEIYAQILALPVRLWRWVRS